MKQRVGIVGLLLAISGCAALALQIGWLREFRLVFGSTTAASAAVLAIFMGGIGLGNAVLGRRVDRHPDPLRYYGQLTFGVAISSAASPWLIDGARTLYVALGGQSRLGPFAATIVRLGLSAAAIGLPTFLMGGTLPAAARAATAQGDRRRSSVGLLYGLNELGAVLGAAASTLWLLEAWGTRATLYTAALLDFVAAMTALWLAGKTLPLPAQNIPPAAPLAAARAKKSPDAFFVYVTAAGLGFAFLLMEIVWYRMLAPIMGGSVYTFGIVLTGILAGISLGGWTFASLPRHWRPGWRVLAISVALEALAVAVPFALGDRLALFAASLTGLKNLGFVGAAAAWVMIAATVVLAASIVSGFQFPLLVALLGQGNRDVGRQVGGAFAWNTLGAIAGSLAGGFGLLPWLTAVGAWRLVVVLLAGLSVLLAFFAVRMSKKLRQSFAPLVCAAAALAAITGTGPTALWRNGAIGAGRFLLVDSSPNQLHDLCNSIRRATLWQAEGIEGSVALFADDGLAFYVNGKSDGNAIVDAGTQIMLPLVGAMLHPQPKSALVIGLGTGESAGWLADVESIEQVTVVELEPAMIEVARECSAANRDVLKNPKVSITFDDAREYLLTSPVRYDLVVSEPSNPYRAGVAALYTQAFYESVAERLEPQGRFLQWLQTYEIDAPAVRTVMATLASVFPHLELWQTGPGDIVFVCSKAPIETTADELRAKIAQEPFHSALANAWRASELEGVLAHYLAGRKLVNAVTATPEPSQRAGHAPNPATPICTDDKNVIEYGLARTLGRQDLFSMRELKEGAIRLGDDRPTISGNVDWEQVTAERLMLWLTSGEEIPDNLTLDQDQQTTRLALEHYLARRFGDAAAAWETLASPSGLGQLRLLTHAYAEQGNFLAELRLARLNVARPTDAELLSAILAARSGRPDAAARRLVAAFERLRTDPWSGQFVVAGLDLAVELSRDNPEQAAALHAALAEPFAVRLLDSRRLATKLTIAQQLDRQTQVDNFLAYEPHVPWTLGFLQARHKVYADTGNPLTSQAERDLMTFHSAADDSSLFPGSQETDK